MSIDTTIVYAKGLAGRVKAIVAVAVPVVTAVEAAVTDNHITSDEWTAIGIAVVGAIGVYFAPNKGASVPVAPVLPLVTPGPDGMQPLDEPPAP